MEIVEALRTRRSASSFAARPISREILLQIIDTARYTPSGVNRNPFRFILTTTRGTIDSLSQTHPYCKWLGSAQAAIVIAGDPAVSPYWLEDCCLAAYSVTLATLAQGISVHWSAIYQSVNPEEDKRRQEHVRKILSIPEGLKVPIVLGAGYPQGQPPARQLAKLEDIVSWEKYGQKA
jgi:nitroreductase